MQFSRKSKAAGSGDNYLSISLRTGDTLKVINMLNATTEFLLSTCELTKQDALTTDPSTIALFHKIIQCGLKDVHWEGNIEMGTHYKVVRGLFHSCTAADAIYLTVGYE